MISELTNTIIVQSILRMLYIRAENCGILSLQGISGNEKEKYFKKVAG